jgi:peptide/nickel transport system permease protein
MDLLRQFAHRCIQLIPILIGISIVVFGLVRLTPGDPARLLVGPRVTEEIVAQVRERYGLDQPLPVQYAHYMGQLLTGHLGDSFRYKVPVGQLIANHLPPTLFLVVYAIVLTLIPTVILATLAARRQGRWIDHVIRVIGVAGMTIPVFWLGIMMSRLFGVSLGWFPVSGYGEGFADHLHHLFLPALSTAIWVTPILVRNLRSALIEEMDSDYVLAARSKGLPEGYIFRGHVFKNSLLPTLHLLGVLVAYLLGGTVIVETVYAVPGLGHLMINSVLARDYFVVQGLTLYFALATVLVTFAVDAATAAIDPRVKL